MSATPLTRRRAGGALALAAAGLALAACNPSNSSFTVTGHPSISIEVPLALTACTATNSCVALGTSALTSDPPVTAQYRANDGRWSALRAPAVSGSTLTTSSCWRTGCLIGGATAAGDLLWRYDARGPSISAVGGPALGAGVVALSCFGPGECALVDVTGVNGGARLVVTSDAGASWSTPEDLSVPDGYRVTALACVDTLDCLVVQTPAGTDSDVRRNLLLARTGDGGITWLDATAPPGAVALTSLECFARGCDALASTSHGVAWARSRALGRGWTLHRLTAAATSLACTPAGHCVIVGSTDRGPWLATTSGDRVTTGVLRYVPAALTAAACGTTLCVLSGPSTVASLAP